MDANQAALRWLEGIFRNGFLTQQLGGPIEECPYPEGSIKDSFWKSGWLCASLGRKLEAVFPQAKTDWPS